MGVCDGNLRPAVFLDRDGTLNEERNYLHTINDWHWIAGVPEALALLAKAGYLSVVVTNQSGIARGLYTLADAEKLHAWMNDDLFRRAGVRFDGIYICPHHPDYDGDCQCRKPKPGMVLKAAGDLGIDLKSSWMIGDKPADMEAGKAAGCRTVFVRTGHGIEIDPAKLNGIADAVVPDLAVAVKIIVR